MRRTALVLALTFAAIIGVATVGDAGQGSARLTIAAVGTDMEFRSLGLSPDAFLVRAGQRRIFQNLKPGRYVVVQAPPIGLGLWIQCSDGESTNQYDLVAGDDLVCTFTFP